MAARYNILIEHTIEFIIFTNTILTDNSQEESYRELANKIKIIPFDVSRVHISKQYSIV